MDERSALAASNGQSDGDVVQLIQDYAISCTDARPLFQPPVTDVDKLLGILVQCQNYSIITSPLQNLQSILDNGLCASNDGIHIRIAGWLVDIDPTAPRPTYIPPPGAAPLTSLEIMALMQHRLRKSYEKHIYGAAPLPPTRMMLLLVPYGAVHAATLTRLFGQMYYNLNGLSVRDAIVFEFDPTNVQAAWRNFSFDFVQAYSLNSANQDAMFLQHLARRNVGTLAHDVTIVAATQLPNVQLYD